MEKTIVWSVSPAFMTRPGNGNSWPPPEGSVDIGVGIQTSLCLGAVETLTSVSSYSLRKCARQLGRCNVLPGPYRHTPQRAPRRSGLPAPDESSVLQEVDEGGDHQRVVIRVYNILYCCYEVIQGGREAGRRRLLVYCRSSSLHRARNQDGLHRVSSCHGSGVELHGTRALA